MGFQQRPSCFLAIVRYLRSLSRDKRSYNKLSGKGDAENDEWNAVTQEECFKGNQPSVPTYKTIVIKIQNLSQSLYHAYEEYKQHYPHVREDNSDLIEHLLNKGYHHPFSSPKDFWEHLSNIKKPGVDADRSCDPEFNEKAFAAVITEALLSLGISDHDSSGPSTEKEIKEQKDIAAKKREEKEKEIPKKHRLVKKKGGDAEEDNEVDEDKKDNEDNEEDKPQARKKKRTQPNYSPSTPLAEYLGVAKEVAKVKIMTLNKIAAKEEREDFSERMKYLFTVMQDKAKYSSEESYHEAQKMLEEIGVDSVKMMEGMVKQDLQLISEHMKKAAGRAWLTEAIELFHF